MTQRLALAPTGALEEDGGPLPQVKGHPPDTHSDRFNHTISRLAGCSRYLSSYLAGTDRLIVHSFRPITSNDDVGRFRSSHLQTEADYRIAVIYNL